MFYGDAWKKRVMIGIIFLLIFYTVENMKIIGRIYSISVHYNNKIFTFLYFENNDINNNYND